ncbi:TetR/AcrR family transcriptional regulator [Pseudoalteromonas denitrificans]|jgi:AcrR family transcriptional regulator|uniref:Transcriptional regulator, TetR family n=1 Tax=Pseudoalteromonas denitrificans DSM 6059 TaxID=1123010 RepID=A0A1I1SU91_9GAMM|nr:TetR/AcrR family transcriptional regulator [Pseudoalteromonas denitrificans]SFD50059.1 transcriptional regulator, TetR family [Pseudoalteromonas denitrificans DSM 6059]
MAPAPKYSPQEQEEIILNAAAECISQTSVLDFTMSAVSKAAKLSMGSIYKHVQCKEDIIFALATRVFHFQSTIFKKILALPLTTPEKITAIALLNPSKTQVYSFDSHLESFAGNDLVISRASSLWTDRMIKANEDCDQVFSKCMHQAAYSGELKLNGNTEEMIEEINLGCWALLMGYQYVDRIVHIRHISDGTDSLNEAVAIDAPVLKSLKRLINSYEWQTPLNQDGITKVANLLVEMQLR